MSVTNPQTDAEMLAWLMHQIRASRDPETSAAIARNQRERERVSIDEVLAKNSVGSTPLGPEVRERVRRLNLNGYYPGDRIRGYHPHHRFARAYNLDVIGPKKFIEKFGREAYRGIPKHALFRNGHRKAIPYSYCQELPPAVGG